MLEKRNEVYYLNNVPYTGTGYQVTDGMFTSDIFVTEENTYPFAYVNTETIKYSFVNGIMQ